MPIQKSPSLYLPSSFSLSSTLFFLSFSAFPTFFLSYYSSEVKQSCCWRHFTPDKLSRCPSFPHSLSFTLLSIQPSSFAPYSCFSWAPFHSIPTPPFCSAGDPPRTCMSFRQGLRHELRGCRQCLQQAPLLVLHAMKLTPSNQLRSCQSFALASEKSRNRQGVVFSFQTESWSTANFKAKGTFNLIWKYGVKRN